VGGAVVGGTRLLVIAGTLLPRDIASDGTKLGKLFKNFLDF